MAALSPETGPAVRRSDISEENYAFLQKYIYQESGIVIDTGKHYLLEARLTPLARREQLKTLNDLCALLRAAGPAPIKREVIEAMTTNETLFFRDLAPFDALRKNLLPPLIQERAASRRISIWSAASSSGQEAYSLAMLLLEMGLKGWNIQILGTDLSDQMVERARAGRYLQIEVNRGLPAPYLVKYFTREGLDWQLRDEVRRMVRFERFDLREPMKRMGPFDLVFCRNVLIYFDVETKKKILGELRGTIMPGGYLLLGAAETTINLDERFVRTCIGTAVFHQVK